MWELLPLKYQAWITVIVVVVVAAIVAAIEELLTGEAVQWWMRIGVGVLLFGTLVKISHFAWRPLWRRFPILQKLLVPDLNGTWNCRILPTWTDDATGEKASAKDAEITIQMTLLDINVSMRTDEITSHSEKAWLDRLPGRGLFKLNYVYATEPKAAVRGRNPRQRGCASLQLDLAQGLDWMTGSYFTDGKYPGDLELSRKE